MSILIKTLCFIFIADSCFARNYIKVEPSAGSPVSRSISETLGAPFYFLKRPGLIDAAFQVAGQIPKMSEISDLAFHVSEEFCSVPPAIRKQRKLSHAGWLKKTMDGGPHYFPDQENMNEVDAFRHYFVSAYLSAKYGRPKMERFMTMREETQKLRVAELMDLHNNTLGFDVGQRLYYQSKQRPMSDEEIRKAIIERGRKHMIQGDFSVLENTGTHKVSGCHYPEHYPNNKHLQVDIHRFMSMKGGVPISCTAFQLNYCEKRHGLRSQVFCLLKSVNVSFEKLVKNTQEKYQGKNEKANQLILAYQKQLAKCQKDLGEIKSFLESPQSHSVDKSFRFQNRKSSD